MRAGAEGEGLGVWVLAWSLAGRRGASARAWVVFPAAEKGEFCGERTEPAVVRAGNEGGRAGKGADG
jgi:hypothetical protein